jgi:hypothetical protein
LALFITFSASMFLAHPLLFFYLNANTSSICCLELACLIVNLVELLLTPVANFLPLVILFPIQPYTVVSLVLFNMPLSLVLTYPTPSNKPVFTCMILALLI